MEFKVLKQYVKELMTAMEQSSIRRLSLRYEGLEVEIERAAPEGGGATESSPSGLLHHLSSAASSSMTSLDHSSASPAALPPSFDEEESLIRSPMVGTFYLSPAPGEPPFVKLGDRVEANQVVCIIEAMKVMNEIKAEKTGTLVEFLVENGDPVEFGSKLFRVR